MVLETERYPGGYQQNNFLAQQGPEGFYSKYQGVTATNPTPYPSYPQVSTYPTTHASQYGSNWSGGEQYHGHGPTHPVKPSTGGYGMSHGYGNSHGYEHSNSFSQISQQGHGSPHGHGHGHGSPPHGHGSPHGHGYGLAKPHGYGESHGYGNSHGYGAHGGATHGHGYGAPAGPNYGHGPSGMINHGYQKPSWTLKGLEDDE